MNEFQKFWFTFFLEWFHSGKIRIIVIYKLEEKQTNLVKRILETSKNGENGQEKSMVKKESLRFGLIN